MSRNNIGQLKRRSKRVVHSFLNSRLDGTWFETDLQAIQEDGVRVRITSSDARADPSIAGEARRLIDRLESDASGDGDSGSLASMVSMRPLRISFAYAVVEVLEEQPDEPVSVVTLLPGGCNFVVPTLKGVKPKRLLEILRADLNRCGAKAAGGWLIVGLHGEFDPVSALYRLHFHAVVAGEMIQLVGRLRKLRKYQSKRRGPGKLRMATDKPIKISRKPITNLPTTVAYVLQSFWPARSIVQLNDGVERKQRTKQRIPSPYHTEVLLWLDQWTLQDMVLLMKIHVSKGQLNASKQ